MSNDGWEVLQVKYAERMTRKSAMFDRYDEHGEPDSDLLMDYSYWILRRPGTTMLIDTGYDLALRPGFDEIETTPVRSGLAELGIDPGDVDGVVLTHYHFDHIGNVGLFPRATVSASRVEHEHWFGIPERIGIDAEIVLDRDLAAIRTAEAEGRLVLLDGITEVVPGVTVHPIPGHTRGQLVVEVESLSGPLLLASDAAHFAEQVERSWNFFVYADVDEMQRSFAAIREIVAASGATVIPGHDARVRDAFPAYPGSAGRFVTVLG